MSGLRPGAVVVIRQGARIRRTAAGGRELDDVVRIRSRVTLMDVTDDEIAWSAGGGYVKSASRDAVEEVIHA